MNSLNIVGRLTRDPELKSTNSGKSFALFGVAVNKRFKRDGEADADFFNCIAWGTTADYVEKYQRKGNLVAVSGRMEQSFYTAQDGSKKERWQLVAESVSGLSQRNQDGNAGDSDGGNYQQPASEPETDEYDPFADE